MTERKKPQDHLPSLKKKPRTKTLFFITDFEKAKELEALRNQNAVAGLLGEEAEEVRAGKIEKLEKDLRNSSVKIVIQSLSRKEYDRLLNANPPTPEQLEEYKDQRQKPTFDIEKYPMALVCASVIEPEVPEDELSAWFDSDDWTGGEFNELFSECISLNSQSNVLTLGKE